MKTFIIHFAVCCFIVFFNEARSQEKISGELIEVLNNLDNTSDYTGIIIVLSDKFDTHSLDHRLIAEKASPQVRAKTVISELQKHARVSQENLRQIFENGRLNGMVREYKTFWLTNAFYAEATAAFIYELSVLEDIEQIVPDDKLELIKPVSCTPAPDRSPGQAEPGLKVINAHKMWQLGFTGQGVIVSNLDTGVEGTHPALDSSWHGNSVPWNQAWLDLYNGTNFPVDQDGHGTLTMGPMVGLDEITSDTIGVAFNSEWIAARTTFTNANLIACLEWLLNPDGNINTTDDMPIVISNAWGVVGQCVLTLAEAISNLEAAGIAAVFVAGNEGPDPQTVIAPADLRLTDLMTFSVGAVDGNVPGFPIASFSGRGPTICTGEGDSIKPEVVAPGVFIRSSWPGGGYTYGIGTSNAGPHVAGAIALLKQAFPDKTGNELKQMLFETAVDLGDPGPDNAYGHGLIDVYAAYIYFQYSENPRPPENFTAFSDYMTPNSIELNWNDPILFVDGSPLVNFDVLIYRDSVVADSVVSGLETYTDIGLNDGNEYFYQIKARDLNSGNVSLPVECTAYSGGSPYPSPPSDISIEYQSGSNSVAINWNDPVTQSDGTPLDDLAEIYIFRENQLIDSVVAGIESYTDNGFFNQNVSYIYQLQAVDNESPVNFSEKTKNEYCFIGDHPEILIYCHEDVTGLPAASADSIFYSLRSNYKISTALSNDLFKFGDDLSGYEAIFVVLGIYPFNHILTVEGNAIVIYLQNGGKLYLEGSECFNFDPLVGGFNIRPWFSLLLGSDGEIDVFMMDGRDFLAGYQCKYEGLNLYMDELVPYYSIPIWINADNADTLGVIYDGYGSNGAITIGVVPSFGGIMSEENPNIRNEIMCSYLNAFGLGCNVGIGDQQSAAGSRRSAVSSFPNPFSDFTTFEYELEEPGEVTLTIFNHLGQQVELLVNEPQTKGKHNVQWNAEDLPAGIYFYRLAVGGQRSAVSDQQSAIGKLVKY